MTLMCLSLLSGFQFSSFPQVFESSGAPPVLNPVLESHEEQFHSLLLIIPIRAFSNQRVKRFSLPFDDHEVELLVNFHTETDLGEGSVPVSCPSNPVFSPGKLYSS